MLGDKPVVRTIPNIKLLLDDQPIVCSTVPKTLKEQVWKIYIGKSIEKKCLVCNNKIITAFDFDCSHVESKNSGGVTTVENLRPTCRSCNLSMRLFCKQYFPNAPVLITFPNYNKCNQCHKKDRYFDKKRLILTIYCSRTCRDIGNKVI